MHGWINDMNSTETVTLVTTLAVAIAKDKSSDEMSLLGSIFTQLGDTLTTIATQNDFNESKCKVAEEKVKTEEGNEGE